MSVRVFSLVDVPVAEAQGIREALLNADIEFFETPSETVGIGDGAAAIWVSDEAADSARFEINKFQREWQQKARAKVRSPVVESSLAEVAFKLFVAGLFAFTLFQIVRVFS